MVKLGEIRSSCSAQAAQQQLVFLSFFSFLIKSPEITFIHNLRGIRGVTNHLTRQNLSLVLNVVRSGDQSGFTGSDAADVQTLFGGVSGKLELPQSALSPGQITKKAQGSQSEKNKTGEDLTWPAADRPH